MDRHSHHGSRRAWHVHSWLIGNFIRQREEGHVVKSFEEQGKGSVFDDYAISRGVNATSRPGSYGTLRITPSVV